MGYGNEAKCPNCGHKSGISGEFHKCRECGKEFCQSCSPLGTVCPSCKSRDTKTAFMVDAGGKIRW